MKVITHVIGLPVIGKNREIKYSIEKYLLEKKKKNFLKILEARKKIINYNYKIQKKLDLITMGNNYICDIVTYTIVNLGIIPKRFKFNNKLGIKEIIKLVKGYNNIKPLKMTKWFNTNYHYFIPEIDSNIKNNYYCDLLYDELIYFKNKKKNKFSIIGPNTLIEISNIKKKKYIKYIFKKYEKLFKKIKKFKIDYIQLEEPIFKINKKKEKIYKNFLKKIKKKIIFTTYFNDIKKNLKYINKFKFYSVHFDSFFNNNINIKCKYLSYGLIDGKNIWINEYNNSIKKIKNNKKVFISGNCSFMHVPYDKSNETSKIKKFLSFSIQKIKEIIKIKKIIKKKIKFKKNIIIFKKLKKIKKYKIKKKDKKIIKKIKKKKRKKINMKDIGIKSLPFTTIGSFPQTNKLRSIRKKYYDKKIKFKLYLKFIKKIIKKNLKIQKKFNINITVNGEPERSDMVEFFCRNFKGCLITKYGWVLSYSTRCIKPPIIYGFLKNKRDIISPFYKKKISKGIITGPVTILKWSYIRYDFKTIDILINISRILKSYIKKFLKKKIKIIQIDEPAVGEFFYENKKNIKNAVISFNYCCYNILNKKIQIHTHICYSKLSKIEIKYFKNIFVDVITIEACKNFKKNVLNVYKKINSEVGFGLYNVHSNNIPRVKSIIKKIIFLKNLVGIKKIWINPDCGLKTRSYKDILLSLNNIRIAIKLFNSYFR
ncbi:5-methyltetrahydropteroyltriglutamate--homocysteine S-methyltransferase [Candidatus Vidania fulgoroideorum]